MGPYPLSDSTNLLGPGSSSYGPVGLVGSGSGPGSGQCYTNYGTNLQTPQPARKCHYDDIDDYSFRRHSAHGRIVRSTSRAEDQLQHLQQQQQQQQQQLQHHQQVHHQSCYPTHEYVHCSYEKEVVCDQANPAPQQPHLEHLEQLDQQPMQQQQQQPSHHCQQQQQQRKHSHSPHHSRHTSPHSHHSVSNNNSSSHHHHSHHRSHRRRRQGSGSLPGAHQASSSSANPALVRPSICTSRRHRSVTELSSHNCQDPACSDREVQEILVRKTCCNTATNSSSRTELAQCFAEDLYGSSRRPSSCCTSSDYCYQTDSTSLYGSRSSLSRNNSIKSASALVKKHHRSQRSLLPEHRHPSYTSISLRGLNASRPNSQLGSLTSIFDRAKNMAPEQGCSLERQSSKGALSSTELPEYACSPSPIRWSFLADGRSPTELEGAVGGEGAEKEPEDKLDAWQVPEPEPEKKPCRKITSSTTTSETCWKSTSSVYDEGPSTSAAAARKRRGSKGSRGSRGSRGSGNYHCEFEEETTTTVMFHQDAGDSYNNCCSNNYNYIQCNSYLDQDLQITSEDIHQYLSKGDATASDILNNSKNYPFQPSNALEFQYKNNFQQGQNLNNNNTNTTNTASSDAAECFQSYRASSKETNLNQSSTEQLSPTNINLSTSSNNINIVFSSSLERNANEVKFINNRGGAGGTTGEIGCESHHAGYLPYTYPSYDYTNMSGNSHFEKPLGIDELPKEFAGAGAGAVVGLGVAGYGGASTTSEHSSSLPSPPPLTHHQQLHHFESFDAASEHNLLAQPLSPGSPLSGSVNPTGDDFVQMHHYHHSTDSPQSQSHQPHHSHAHSHAHHTHQHQHQHPHQHTHHQHSHHTCDLTEEQFRLGSALKRVRKRARKYTDFLRKK
ncbi:hypothetical protein KR067_005332 [Drosophila pandora]|nr:hypothetical protein KR067_005332 [Drosophila pandora]